VHCAPEAGSCSRGLNKSRFTSSSLQHSSFSRNVRILSLFLWNITVAVVRLYGIMQSTVV